MRRVLIGQLLKERGLINEVELLTGLVFQRKWGGRLGDALLRLRLVREDDLLAALGRQSGVPAVCIGNRTVAPEVLRSIPEKLARRRQVFPLGFVGRAPRRSLLFATSTPCDLSLLDDVAFAAGMRADPAVASSQDIARAIARHFGESA